MKNLEKMKRTKILKLFLLQKIVIITMGLVCIPACICVIFNKVSYLTVLAFIVLFLLLIGLFFIQGTLIVEKQKRDEEARQKAQLENMRKTMEEIDSWDA